MIIRYAYKLEIHVILMNMHKNHEMCLKGKQCLFKEILIIKKVVGSLSESYGGGDSRGVAKSYWHAPYYSTHHDRCISVVVIN